MNNRKSHIFCSVGHISFRLFFIIFMSLVMTKFVACQCPRGYTFKPEIPGCYLSSQFIANWTDAEAYCKSSYGGWLVTVNSDEENSLLADMVVSDAWIGYERVHDTFQWTKGTSLYTNWALGQPDNTDFELCTEIWASDSVWGNAPYATWNNAPCDYAFNFICEACPAGYASSLSPFSSCSICPIGKFSF